LCAFLLSAHDQEADERGDDDEAENHDQLQMLLDVETGTGVRI
jgi:hypothetical protein